MTSPRRAQFRSRRDDRDDRDRLVLVYLLKHQGSTARDVAIDVLRGSGATRTNTRRLAASALLRLESRGVVRRERETGGGRQAADRWYVIGVPVPTASLDTRRMCKACGERGCCIPCGDCDWAEVAS